MLIESSKDTYFFHNNNPQKYISKLWGVKGSKTCV